MKDIHSSRRLYLQLRRGVNSFVLLLLVLFLAVVASCEFAPGREPFSVTDCSVDEGQIDRLPTVIRIGLNRETSLSSAVSSLVLLENGVPLYCDIDLEGPCLVMRPWRPLRESNTYQMRLNGTLRSLEGQSLGHDWMRSFSCRAPDVVRLQMDSFLPPATPDARLELGFSAPIDVASGRGAISLDPDWPVRVSTGLRDDGGGRCVLDPVIPWPPGETFTVFVSARLATEEGDCLEQDEIRTFSLEEERPSLVSLRILDAEGSLLHTLYPGDLPVPETLYGLPPGFSIALEWHRPYLLRALDGIVYLGDRPLLRDERAQSPVFEEARTASMLVDGDVPWAAVLPLWTVAGNPLGVEEGGLLVGDGGVAEGTQVLAWLAFDDPSYEPPRVEGLRYILFDSENHIHPTLVDPGDALTAFAPPIDWYPLDTARPFAVEFFVHCAPGLGIDPIWFLEHADCRFDSEAFTLVLDVVRFEDFSIMETAEGFEGRWRCEFSGLLTNRGGRGLVNFDVPAGMPDTGGGKSVDRFLVTLCK